MSNNFYNYVNDDYIDEEDNELPVETQHAQVSRQTSRNQSATHLIDNANAQINQAKQLLYEKIDVCCAQYGLYGLQIMEQAISQSLSNMINNGRQTMQPVIRQQNTNNFAQQFAESNQYQQPVVQKSNLSYEEYLANSFMNNLDEVMSNCDKEFDKKAEIDMKQRLFEQKQYDMLAAQNKVNMSNKAEETLINHINDYAVVSEEDLRANG